MNPDRPVPSSPGSPGSSELEPTDEEIEQALAFAPERHPERASLRRKLKWLTGATLAGGAAVLAGVGYEMGGLPMAVGLVGAGAAAALFRLAPSLLAARERRRDRERAREIALARRRGLSDATPDDPPRDPARRGPPR